MEILIKLAPLWWIILAVAMFFAMRFYYTRFKKAEAVTEKVKDHPTAIKTLETKTEYANCKANSEKLTDLQKLTLNIEKDLAFIRGVLTPTADAFTKAQSPVSLTDKGENLAVEVGADDILERNKIKIVDFVDRHSASKNAYDIQQLCIETAVVGLADLITEDDIDRLKTYAFAKGLTMFSIGNVLGVMMRDLYFKERNIHVDEVDKSNPN